jgi:hypothetical protein
MDPPRNPQTAHHAFGFITRMFLLDDEAITLELLKLDPAEGGLDVATVYARRRELSGTGVTVWRR